MRLCLLCALAMARAPPRTPCPLVKCEDWMATPHRSRWTGRFAVIVSGHLRTVADQVPSVRRLIAANPQHAVDVYYHVWANASAPCDLRALEAMRTVAAAVTLEPLECAWTWCGPAFRCQWHGVERAWISFEKAARRRGVEYTLVVKTRTDVGFAAPFYNFTHWWHRYARGPRGPNFLVLTENLGGWDVHALGTPSAVRAWALYEDSDPHSRCDSAVDEFAFRRPTRYGIQFSPAEAARKRSKPVQVASTQDLPDIPRCASLYTARAPVRLLRSAFRYGPEGECEPTLVYNHSVSAFRPVAPPEPRGPPTRRLAAKRPPESQVASREYCESRREIVFYRRVESDPPVASQDEPP